MTMITFTSFDPTLVVGYFNAFVSCIRVDVSSHEVVIAQGLDCLQCCLQCFLNTTSHLSATNPTSSILKDVCQDYVKIFPAYTKLHDHQSYHIVKTACCLFVPHEYQSFHWSNYNPSPNEHTTVTHNLANIFEFKPQRTEKVNVYHFVLCFVLHSLSLYPLPSMSIIANCLSIIVIDLGCNVPETRTIVLDERYGCIWQVNTTLTPN